MPKSVLKAITLGFLTLVSFHIFFVVAADTTAPVTTKIQTPAAPDGNNGWYVTPVQFDLTATDLESGVKEINYRVDGGTWQTQTFADSLNLAPNPSFETPAGTSSGVADWEATVFDGSGSYIYDIGDNAPGFASASERITATGGAWHGINNQTSFSAATPFGNMTSSAWLKTNNVTGNAYFKMYSVSQDGSGSISYVYLGDSTKITGTNDWTYVKLDFIVNDIDSIGVYMDLGIENSGVAWADAVTISESLTSANTSFTVSTDSTGHTIEYYSVDVADNTETYGCPASNCTTFKLDQTPPGNWMNSGAVRGLGGADHEVYVFTDVSDTTSGLSTNSDIYQYTVDSQATFGYYENLIFCNTPWHEDEWRSLLTGPVADGETTSTLTTPKTDFCNSNWKICKDVRFYAEDMAGNSVTKDFCINGPWIKVRGEGVFRGNQNIDMIAESDEHNTDSVIEIGGQSINFFTSSRNWSVKETPAPEALSFSTLLSMADSYTTISGSLVTTSGVYFINGDYEINNANTPNNYNSEVFNQIVFIDGDLLVANNISIDDESTALFIVSGDVNVEKKVDVLGIAVITDQEFYSAYDIAEGESTKTLEYNGVYAADRFYFQRTLQGTNNEKNPSSYITFEPKYIMQLRGYFGTNNIIWRSVE
ncbi:hypothetical protein ACFLZK_01480 [Patescibacteria group bacterium]